MRIGKSVTHVPGLKRHLCSGLLRHVNEYVNAYVNEHVRFDRPFTFT